MKRFICHILLFFGLWTTVQAQTIWLQASTDSVKIGERFSFSVYAEKPANESVVFPAVPAVMGDFELLEVTSSEQIAQGPNGKPVEVNVYDATTFALDSAFVESVPVMYVVGQDSTVQLSSSLTLRVISTVPEDAQGIRDIIPLADFPDDSLWWLWTLLGVLAGLLVAYYFFRKYRKQPEIIQEAPKRKLTPYEIALKRLEAIEDTDLSIFENVNPYYVELTETLRQYLEDATEVPAMEQTTTELITSLKQPPFSARVRPELTERIEDILRLADLAKFADYHPTDEMNEAVLENTRYILAQVEKRMRPYVPAEEGTDEEHSEEAV